MYVENYDTKHEAVLKKNKLKSMKSRKFIEDLIKCHQVRVPMSRKSRRVSR